MVDAYAAARGFDISGFEPIDLPYNAFFRAVGEHHMDTAEIHRVDAIESYDAFKPHIMDQFLFARAHGIVPRLCREDPFSTFDEMCIACDRQCVHSHDPKEDDPRLILDIYDVEPIDDSAARGYVHPMMEFAGVRDVTGTMMVWHDVWQFVHDVFSHLAFGLGFGFTAELDCFRAHRLLFPRSDTPALLALANETVIRVSSHGLNGDAFLDPPRIVDLPPAWFVLLYDEL